MVSINMCGMMSQQDFAFEVVEDRAPDYVIEFDGGSSCNIPRLGFGVGYGSWRVMRAGDGVIVGERSRETFGEGYSANAAEVANILSALRWLVGREREIGRVSLIIRGDSQIALGRCRRRIGAGGKISVSALYRSLCVDLAEVCLKVGFIKTEWRGRSHSVALFGH